MASLSSKCRNPRSKRKSSSITSCPQVHTAEGTEFATQLSMTTIPIFTRSSTRLRSTTPSHIATTKSQSTTSIMCTMQSQPTPLAEVTVSMNTIMATLNPTSATMSIITVTMSPTMNTKAIRTTMTSTTTDIKTTGMGTSNTGSVITMAMGMTSTFTTMLAKTFTTMSITLMGLSKSMRTTMSRQTPTCTRFSTITIITTTITKASGLTTWQSTSGMTS